MGVFDDMMKEVKENVKKGFFSRLFDMEDTSVSATNVFLVIISMIGLLLLFIPAIAIGTELFYTHTVSMSWSDIASYIGAVSCLFASGGITKAWSNWSNYKYNMKYKGHATLFDESSQQNTNENDTENV